MKIIVGLGNPGSEYRQTRHNVGWQVLDGFARQHGLARGRVRFRSRTAAGTVRGEKLVLLWPRTYVNLTGEAVAPAVRWYGAELTDLLVVCDDFHLVLGRLRLRRKGGSGGHNGLASITQHLGSDTYPRLRIGIHAEAQTHDRDFVLSRFNRDEGPLVQEAIKQAVSALNVWIEAGLEAAMNLYN